MSSDGGCETDYDEVPSARVISKPKHTYGGKQRQRRLHQQPVRRESVRARTEDGVVRAVAGSSSDTEVDMRRTLGRTSSAVELGKRARSVNRREDQTRNDDGAQSDVSTAWGRSLRFEIASVDSLRVTDTSLEACTRQKPNSPAVV